MTTFIVYSIAMIFNCTMFYYTGKAQGKREIIEKIDELKI